MAKAQGSSKPLSRRTEVILGVLGLITIILLWQLACSTRLVSPNAVPQPLDVLFALGALSINTSFWLGVFQTISVTLLAVVIVVLVSIPVGMAIHRSMVFRESTWFVIEFLKPIPPVALIPLMALLWGPTKSMELFLASFAALWPMLTQVVYGLREVSGTSLDVAKVYRFNSSQRTFRIVVPSLTPFAMTGLRISVTMALVVAIVVEYIVGVPGLGAMLSTSQANGVLDRMWALIVTTGLLGLALNGLITLANKPLLFWHPSQRERVAA